MATQKGTGGDDSREVRARRGIALHWGGHWTGLEWTGSGLGRAGRAGLAGGACAVWDMFTHLGSMGLSMTQRDSEVWRKSVPWVCVCVYCMCACVSCECKHVSPDETGLLRGIGRLVSSFQRAHTRAHTHTMARRLAGSQAHKGLGRSKWHCGARVKWAMMQGRIWLCEAASSIEAGAVPSSFPLLLLAAGGCWPVAGKQRGSSPTASPSSRAAPAPTAAQQPSSPAGPATSQHHLHTHTHSRPSPSRPPVPRSPSPPSAHP
jgi:hypothetical protein